MKACPGSRETIGAGAVTEVIREGVLTRTRPSARAHADIGFGLPIVQRLRALDIGHAIAVKEREVIAVETREGLEAMVRRAGELCAAGRWILMKTGGVNGEGPGFGAVVDVATIRAMKDAGATCLAVVTERTLPADRGAAIAEADRARIAIVGVAVQP